MDYISHTVNNVSHKRLIRTQPQPYKDLGSGEAPIAAAVALPSQQQSAHIELERPGKEAVCADDTASNKPYVVAIHGYPLLNTG